MFNSIQIPVIAYDESGNTGQNLLDQDQPFFILASVCFSEDEMNSLTSVFSSKARELHFKKMRKYEKSRKELLEMYNHDLLDKSKVKIHYSYKKFALYDQIVDRVIEPLLHKDGINIYKNKANIVAANLLYYFGNSHKNTDLIYAWLKGFQDFNNKQDLLSFQKFISLNIEVRNTAKESDPIEFLDFITHSSLYSQEIIRNTNKKYVIDLTFPSFVASCHYWYQELNTEFDILHDDSKAISFWKSMIDFLANPKKMEEKVVGYGDIKESYPLRIRKLSLVNSEDHLSIQIADLIASAINYGLKVGSGTSDSFGKSIWESRLFKIGGYPLIPLSEQELRKVIAQEPMKGEDPIAYIAEMLAKDS